MSSQNETADTFRLLKLMLSVLTVVLLLFIIFIWNSPKQTAQTELVAPSIATSTVDTSVPATTTTTTTLRDPELIIVAFGDSITAGYGLAISEAYPQILQSKLRAEKKNVTVVNAGVTGETSAGGLRRAEFIVAQKPDIVILALGGNDVLRGIPPASVKENLGGIITIFQQANIRVILAGMRAPTNLGPTYVAEFDAIYPALARKHSLALVPFLLQNVALVPNMNQPDGIHPNSLGVKIIVEQNILPVLLPLLD